MDWATIILAVLGTGGLLGSGGLVGAHLAARKSREESVDQRYERLIDGLQKEVARTIAANDRMRDRLDAATTHVATLHQELAQEREQRLATERRTEELERRHREERDRDAARIAELESEVARLRTMLTAAGITDDGGHHADHVPAT
jgi:septal ring factor EnvC (AmiA/AmiB activator)